MKKITLKNIKEALKNAGMPEYPKYIGNGLWKLADNIITGERGLRDFDREVLEHLKKHKVMKANGAPEKLYLHPTANGEVGSSWLAFPLTNEDIEYTRTDAFVDKAAKWIRDNANDFLSKSLKGEPYLYRYGLAAEFIKAMMKE